MRNSLIELSVALFPMIATGWLTACQQPPTKGAVPAASLLIQTCETSEGISLVVTTNGKYGYIDAQGNTLVAPVYDAAYPFHEGVALVGKANEKGELAYQFIDKKGMVCHAVTLQHCLLGTRVHNGLLSYQDLRNGTRGYMDLHGNLFPALEEKDTMQTARPTIPPAEKKVNISSLQWREISKQNPFYEEASKVVSGKLEERDSNRRRLILNYVEHLRTSYTTKDIDFLEQLFSDQALIVVGTVVKRGSDKETGYLSPQQVIYNVKSKQQYLERLKQVFKANRRIEVEFSGFKIMRHPTLPGIYGVSLKQGYRSDLYSDEGYLFLLWDFRDETAPKIDVRTWQPSMLNDNHGSIPEIPPHTAVCLLFDKPGTTVQRTFVPPTKQRHHRLH